MLNQLVLFSYPRQIHEQNTGVDIHFSIAPHAPEPKSVGGKVSVRLVQWPVQRSSKGMPLQRHVPEVSNVHVDHNVAVQVNDFFQRRKNIGDQQAKQRSDRVDLLRKLHRVVSHPIKVRRNVVEHGFLSEHLRRLPQKGTVLLRQGLVVENMNANPALRALEKREHHHPRMPRIRSLRVVDRQSDVNGIGIM